MRFCSECGCSLQEVDVAPSIWRKGGAVCRPCVNAAGRARWWANPEQRREFARRYYHAHPEQYARAKQAPDFAARRLAVQRTYRAKNRLKVNARATAWRAVRDGKLLRQPCEFAGCTVVPEMHHDDYAKPLEVRWLCRTHHRLAERDPAQSKVAGAF